MNTERMKELRKGLGLSQQEAADAADLAGKQHWNNIERGRQDHVTIDQIQRIAGVLGVPYTELVLPPKPIPGKRKPKR